MADWRQVARLCALFIVAAPVMAFLALSLIHVLVTVLRALENGNG